jgi:UDP-N-acetylglucosamine--N-acetylmuramyl-(pentapeptide) pyrophosphoryl-undecaprenol N-acetylglucosamine transferase
MNDIVCFVAGKSGGHLIPCITLAQKLSYQNPHQKILFFTTQSSLDYDIIANHQFITRHIGLPLPSLQRTLYSYCRFIIMMLWSWYISLYHLIKLRPKKIVSTGGALSLPVCFAGWMLAIPFELIELNVVPGKAITALGPFAKTTSICFNETQRYFKQKCFITHYPLRFTQRAKISPASARKHLGLNQTKKTIFIIGGSQGSLFINTIIKKWIEHSFEAKDTFQFIHQTGFQDTTDWKKFYADHGLQAFTFTFYSAIEYCYSAADFIICRSGAGTLFEIQFFNKPCITIPLETKSTNHQIDNAYAFKKMHTRCDVILQSESPDTIISRLQKTIQYL